KIRHMALCKNCEVSLTDGVRYCPSCGQSVHVHRLNTRFLFHEGVHYLTHADKGIFHLIRDLAVKRGVVAREYIAGKRRKYFSPLPLVMLVGAVLVSGPVLGEAKQSSDCSEDPDVIKIVDPAEGATMQGFLDRRQKSHHFTNKCANL